MHGTQTLPKRASENRFALLSNVLMARHKERAENRPGFVRRDRKAILPTKLGQEHRILAASRDDLSPPQAFPIPTSG
jgi:hypothetical protein